ncbi:MAG: VOC family protein [Bdellovibrionales bacterium]|nr:VOC family protein [Bdellovibrionales bacterium]
MVTNLSPLTILETSLYVTDLEAARLFYSEILNLEYHSGLSGRHHFFRCGSGMLLLFQPDVSSRSTEIPAHGGVGPGHVAFQIEESALKRWGEHLISHGVAVEHEHTWPNGARSLYFRDPAGNSLELATPSLWARL